MIKYSTALRNAMMSTSAGGGNGLAEILDGATLTIYTGDQPLDPDATATGTLLLTLDGLTFGDATAGTISKPSGEEWSAEVVDDGRAGWFRLTGPSGESLDGALGYNLDMQFLNYDWVYGQIKTFSTFSITLPIEAVAQSAGEGDDIEQLTMSRTVTVGPGGDYATINDALDYYSTYCPIYAGGNIITATINLLQDFVMDEVVRVDAIDLGWVEIVGECYITECSNTAGYVMFWATHGGRLPRIAHRFTWSASNEINIGVWVDGPGSSCYIGSPEYNEYWVDNCGDNSSFIVTNGGTLIVENVYMSSSNGIIADTGSKIIITNSDITQPANARAPLIEVHRASSVTLKNTDLEHGSDGPNPFIRITSGSKVHAEGSTIQQIAAATGPLIVVESASFSAVGTDILQGSLATGPLIKAHGTSQISLSGNGRVNQASGTSGPLIIASGSSMVFVECPVRLQEDAPGVFNLSGASTADFSLCLISPSFPPPYPYFFTVGSGSRLVAPIFSDGGLPPAEDAQTVTIASLIYPPDLTIDLYTMEFECDPSKFLAIRGTETGVHYSTEWTVTDKNGNLIYNTISTTDLYNHAVPAAYVPSAPIVYDTELVLFAFLDDETGELVWQPRDELATDWSLAMYYTENSNSFYIFKARYGVTFGSDPTVYFGPEAVWQLDAVAI